MSTRRRVWSLASVGLIAGVVALAGCGGKSGGSTSASATQRVKRLEVTVVSSRAEVPGPARMLVRAAELLGWPRRAEAAVCTVSAGGQTVQTDASGKATLLNVPVDASGIIPVTISCNGVTSTVNITGTPGAIVAVTVEVGGGSVEVKAKSESVSEPSTPSQPSTSKKSPDSESDS